MFMPMSVFFATIGFEYCSPLAWPGSIVAELGFVQNKNRKWWSKSASICGRFALTNI
jgi:hypothetical protein